MRTKLFFFLLLFSICVKAQNKLDALALKVKGNQAYLKKEYAMAYQNYSKALELDQSCDVCRSRLHAIRVFIKAKNTASFKEEKSGVTQIPIGENISLEEEKYVFEYPEMIPLDLRLHELGTMNSIYMAKTEVLQKDWRVFCKENNHPFPKIEEQFLNDEFPIIHVTWNDAKKYCEWISEKTGKIFDLPTLIEWQEARKAMKNLQKEAWVFANSKRMLHVPCSKLIQKNGLCDIEGNVAEWLLDWADEENLNNDLDSTFYANTVHVRRRLVAGCSFREESFLCDQPFIRDLDAGLQMNFVGFRLVERKF